jgi:polyisoprenoid-binding protein YceI
MKKILVSIFALAALSSFKADKEQTYKVDATKSTLVWVGKKVTGEHKGNIPVSNGSLLFSGKKLTGGSFELDVASLTVTDITESEKNAKLVGHLKANDFFATAKFPKANFKITKVEAKDAENYVITGDLTIKGITQSISFPTLVKVNGKSLTAAGLITVNRTKFDIKFRSTSFFENLGDKAIYDDFTLDVKLEAAL